VGFCMFGFCNVLVSVSLGLEICECVYVWVL